MAIDPNQINQLKGKQIPTTYITKDNLGFNRNIQIQGPGNNVPEDNGMNLDYYSLLNLGLAGISAGLNFNQDLQNRQDLYTSIQNRDSKPLYDYNYMYGRTTSGGTEFQPVIKAEMGAEINKRYNTPQGVNNVEIEGGEFLQLPDMSTELAYGPSHNNGGVKTSLPNGTRVFSNHLKPMGSKKTFAQMAKKYDTSEYDKILDNKFAKQVDKDTAMIMKQKNQKMLDKLFMDQQLLNGNSNGEPMAKNGASINNAGFKTLPQEVQNKILASMANGGTSPNTPPDKSGLPKALQPYVKWDANFGKPGKKGTWRLEVPPNLSIDEIRNITQAANTFGYENLVQTSNERLQGNPNANFKGFYAGLSPKDFERKLIEEELGVEEANKLNEIDTRKKAFEMLGIDGSQYDLNDPQSLYNNPQFAAKFYKAFTTYLPESKFRPELGNDVRLGFEHLDAIKGKKKPATEESPKDESKKEDPKTADFKSVEGKQSGKYYRQDFPLIQAVPQAIGLAESQELFPYAIPEIDSQYLRPQTLNIQSELQDIDNMGQAAIRAGADPLATYIAGMQGKQKAFQTKQNYDAEGRSRADMFNAQADQQANMFNAQMFDRTYNNLIAQARDAQTAEQQAAIASLANNYSKYNQDENLKSLYLDNLQTAFEIGKDRPFSMTLDKNGKPVFTFDSMQESTTDTKTTKSENTTTPKLGSKSKSKTSNK